MAEPTRLRFEPDPYTVPVRYEIYAANHRCIALCWSLQTAKLIVNAVEAYTAGKENQ